MNKYIIQHHFDIRFILTPFAIASWVIKGNQIRMYYIFGVRVARIHTN